MFASSSVLVPYCMGAVAGAIASGRVPAGGEAGDPWSSWVNPTSILGGVLAVTRRARTSRPCTWSGTRAALDDDEMAEYFRRRAVVAAVVAGVVAFVGHLRAARRRHLRLPRAHVARAAARDRVRAVRARIAGACSCAAHIATRALLAIGAVASVVVGLGRRAVAVHPPDEPEGLPGGRARRNADRGARRVRRRGGDDPARRSACSTSSTSAACSAKKARELHVVVAPQPLQRRTSPRSVAGTR